MIRKSKKKILALAMALLLLSGSVPVKPISDMVGSFAVTASAAAEGLTGNLDCSTTGSATDYFAFSNHFYKVEWAGINTKETQSVQLYLSDQGKLQAKRTKNETTSTIKLYQKDSKDSPTWTDTDITNLTPGGTSIGYTADDPLVQGAKKNNKKPVCTVTCLAAAPVWTWSNDFSTCSVTFTCDDNTDLTTTFNAPVTQSDDTFTATATFNSTTYTDSKTFYAFTLPANMEITNGVTLTDGKVLENTEIQFKAATGYTASNVSDGTNTIEPDESGVYAVTVTGDTVITADVSQIDYAISMADGITNGSVTVKVGETENATTAHYNESVTLTVVPDEGYCATSVTVNGEALASADDTTYTFNMPAGEATVNAVFALSTTVTHTITYYLDGEVYGDVETVAYGAPLTLRAAPTLAGHTFSGWTDLPETMPNRDLEVTGYFTVNSYAVTLPDHMEFCEGSDSPADYGTEVKFQAATGYTASNVSYGTNAIEPDESGVYAVTVTGDTAITATLSPIDYAISKADGITNGSVTVTVGETENATTAHYDDAVILTVVPNAGYSVTSVTVNDEAIIASAGVYTFNMLAKDVTVNAVFSADALVGVALTGNLDCSTTGSATEYFAFSNHFYKVEWAGINTKETQSVQLYLSDQGELQAKRTKNETTSTIKLYQKDSKNSPTWTDTDITNLTPGRTSIGYTADDFLVQGAKNNKKKKVCTVTCLAAAPVWTWSNDFSTCSVTFTCDDNTDLTTTFNAPVTQSDDSFTATATFNSTTYTDSKTFYAFTLPANMEITNGVTLTDGKVLENTEIQFKAATGYTASNVSDGTNTIEPDESGVYAVTVTGNTVITADVSQIDYAISKADGIANGSVTVTVGETVDATTAHYNESVTLTVSPDEDYAVASVTVNGEALASADDTTYTFNMPAGEATVNAVFEKIIADPELLQANTVSFKDNLSLNFLAKIDDTMTDGAYVVFSYLHYGTQTKVTVQINTSDKNGKYYRFRCPLTASELAIPVTAALYMKESAEPVSTWTRSIREVCVAGLTDDATPEAEKTLLLAAMNYGGYTQRRFGYNGEPYANKDYEQSVESVTVTSAIDYAKPTGVTEGLEYIGATVLLRNAPFARYYFRLAEGASIDDYTFSVAQGGTTKKYTPTLSGDRYYIETAPELAYQLDNKQTVTVTKNEEAIMSFDYSILKWAELAAADTQNTKDRDVAKAMFVYYQAATGFVASR